MNQGFVVLLSIIILGALILAVSIGVSLRVLTQAQIGFQTQAAYEASTLAEFCAELALFKLESILGYGGNEIIMNNGQSCEILTIEGTGNLNRTVKTQSTVSSYTRKIKVQVARISPLMEITSFQEVPNF